MFWRTRRWRAVRNTPLATLADTLINGGQIYGELLELGLTTTDRRSKFRACGFDTDNRWYWLDVEVDGAVVEAWLDAAKQRRVRELLDAQLLYFKQMGEVIRIWFRRGAGGPPGPTDQADHRRQLQTPGKASPAGRRGVLEEVVAASGLPPLYRPVRRAEPANVRRDLGWGTCSITQMSGRDLSR